MGKIGGSSYVQTKTQENKIRVEYVQKKLWLLTVNGLRNNGGSWTLKLLSMICWGLVIINNWIIHNNSSTTQDVP